MQVNNHPTTHIVGRRDDRNRLAGQINSVLQTALGDDRKALTQKICAAVADVEEDRREAVRLHLAVNRPRHHVAGRQLGPLIVLGP